MRISDWSSDVCSSDLSLSGAARHSNARTATLSSTGSEGGCAEASTGPITGVAAGSGVGTSCAPATAAMITKISIAPPFLPDTPSSWRAGSNARYPSFRPTQTRLITHPQFSLIAAPAIFPPGRGLHSHEDRHEVGTGYGRER